MDILFHSKYFKIYRIIILVFLLLSWQTISLADTSAAMVYHINTNAVNLRSAPSISASVIAILKHGEKVTLFESTENWCRIATNTQVTGWVYYKYLTPGLPPTFQTASRNSSPIEELLSYAYTLLNCKYRRGGTTPSGFDCSGFTMYVFSKIGLTLPHKALSQSNLGAYISKAELIKGDLVFFKTLNSPVINHVGIYIGDGNFIHASSGSGRVRINSLNTGYYLRCYQTARRLFGS